MNTIKSINPLKNTIRGLLKITKNQKNLIVTIAYLYLEISDVYLTPISPLAPFWLGPILPS